MFIDFDEVFNEEKYKDVKLTDQCPCRDCEVIAHDNDIPSSIYKSEIRHDECINCPKYVIWKTKCIEKLIWLENKDESCTQE